MSGPKILGQARLGEKNKGSICGICGGVAIFLCLKFMVAHSFVTDLAKNCVFFVEKTSKTRLF